jgi:hypothetical protein
LKSNPSALRWGYPGRLRENDEDTEARRISVTSKTAITVLVSPAEAQRLWQSPEHRPAYNTSTEATVTIKRAPGDRGTEIYVDLKRQPPEGKLGEAVLKLVGSYPRAKAKDDLRRFKQKVETGVIVRSEGAPEPKPMATRALKQRPAQPLREPEREKAGVR